MQVQKHWGNSEASSHVEKHRSPLWDKRLLVEAASIPGAALPIGVVALRESCTSKGETCFTVKLNPTPKPPPTRKLTSL